MRKCVRNAAISLTILLLSNQPQFAADPETEDVLAGHSFHGEAFNEGPRQSAYLMPGLEGISFPVTTSSERTQQFVNQGVAQLHGFWYYEAERSFRQASMLDPDCAMCYWGMALANIENRKRAKDFIATAVEKLEGVTPREKMYIEAASTFFREKDEKNKSISKKDRAQKYTRDLEAIVIKFPNDIEARALLALQLYHNSQADLPIVSYVAVDSILQDVFDTNPSHPAHHYRIHLWDRQQPENALASAAACGPSLPAVAHMWHMPGHIYSRLHRYHDAAWQQEASARVDHAHMMRDRVMPDQIHNFAHNNEWFIRNLIKLGRVEDALSLAKNMIELPRHPKYNTLTRGSGKFGRERLILTLRSFRLWDQLIALADTDYLSPTDSEKLQIERLHLLAVAHALSGSDDSEAVVKEIEDWRVVTKDRIAVLETAQDSAAESGETQQGETSGEGDNASPQQVASDAPEASLQSSATDEIPKSESPTETSDATTESDENTESDELPSEETPETAKSKADQRKAATNRAREKKAREEELKKLQERLKQLDKAIAAYEASSAAARGEWGAALDGWTKAGFDDELLRAEWLAEAGKHDDAIKKLDEQIEKLPGEVLPLAIKAWVQHKANQTEAAKETFEKLRKLASTANLDTPLLARLEPLASAAGYPSDWSAELTPATDLGPRPELDSLGPFRWRPYLMPKFDVISSDKIELTRSDIAGRPTVVIFYLGFGCLHCVEQLHAFSPRVADFAKQEIDIIAISSESVASLNEGLEGFDEKLHIPLHSDETLEAFRAFRCYDDFEQQPLHGTFLIAADGRVLWQDIGYEPFMDVDFTLAEAKRLLKIHTPAVD